MGIVLEWQYNGCSCFCSYQLIHFPLLCYLLPFLNRASVSWFFCCSSFIASSLTLSSDSLHSLALLLPVCWDGSRTAGSVLQSSVSGFNIPIQSPLAVFSHPAHAGTLSFTLLLLLSFFTTFHFISHFVFGYMCLTHLFHLFICWFVQPYLKCDVFQHWVCHSSELQNVQESGGKNTYILYSPCAIISYFGVT